MPPCDARKAILFVSNGHGEDAIGAQLAQRVQSLAGDRLRLVAFPVVGAGEAYRKVDIPVVGPQGHLPSGGLSYLHPRNMMRDLLAGGLGLVLRQLCFAWRRRDHWDAVVGVGDRVSLHLNRRILKRPIVWVAIGYTVRVVPPGKQFGNPKRWAPLNEPDVDAFVRDPDSQVVLKAMGYRTEYVGNPMRDGLEPEPEKARRVQAALRATGWDGTSPVVALLPGSREDALLNLSGQLDAFRQLHERMGGRVHAIVAWAPVCSSATLADSLAQSDWRLEDAPWDGWSGGPGEGVAIPADPSLPGPKVPLLRGSFAEILDACTAVIGQAGTAVEQATGLGKPVVSFESTGLVVTRRFLARQQRMLRGAIEVARPEPVDVATKVLAILSDAERYRSMSEAGKRLMGPPGATDAIAQRIIQRFAR